MTTLLNIESVTVRYGRTTAKWKQSIGFQGNSFTAVDDVTLAVPEGGAVGVVGESGSGKSTLMRAVMGLTPIDEGKITFAGKTLERHRDIPTRRAIQMVFQDPGTTLNPARSVGTGIVELLRVHRIVPRGASEARAKALLDKVHLPTSVFGARPHELSGGQKQRVAIARALAVEPSIVIADEATSALDVLVQAQILDLLTELRTTSNITLVCVTHDLDLVRYLCDQAVVMRSGKVVESGLVEDIFANPQSEYTRELLAAAPVFDSDHAAK